MRLGLTAGRAVRFLAAIPLAAQLVFATASCGSATHGPQLDIVLRTQMGRGNETAAAAHFPHARYTFFAFEDPTLCLSGVELLDASGHVSGGETFDRQAERPAINVPVPLVQQNLTEGDYRLRITTDAPRCSWMVQEILNSMSTQGTPPTAEPASPSPKMSATVQDPTTAFDIPQAGLYGVSWMVTPPPKTACPYVISLKTSAGDTELIDQNPEPGTPTMSGGSPADYGRSGGMIIMFLDAGARTVSALTSCPWQVSVAPLIGPNGGGVRGFA
jgi:hypothetical protein